MNSADRRSGVAGEGQQSTPESLAVRARRVLEGHAHFRGRFDEIRIHDSCGVLVLTGKLPSYYLKQVLQNALGKVAGVIRIDNRVDVVAADGLSSTAESPGSQHPNTDSVITQPSHQSSAPLRTSP